MKPILFETETEAYDEDDIVEMVGRIAKLESAIRGCMEQEGFDDTQEAFEWWVSDNQPDEIRTVKGE